MSGQEDEIIFLKPPTTDRRTYRFFIYLGLLGFIASIITSILQWSSFNQYLDALITENPGGLSLSNELMSLYRSCDFEIQLLFALGFFGYLSKNGSKFGIVYVLLSLNIVLLAIYATMDNLFISFLNGLQDFSFISDYAILIASKVVLACILLKTYYTTSNRPLLSIAAVFPIIMQIFYVVWNHITEGFQTSVEIMLAPNYSITLSYLSNRLLYLPYLILPNLILITAALLFVSELKHDE